MRQKEALAVIKNEGMTAKTIVRMDRRIEWICEHGVGHTIWYPKGNDAVHGCCGEACCSQKEVVELINKIKNNGKH